MEATRIVDQILAKLGPEFRQSRDPKRRPPTPEPQWVRSVSKDISNKSADKTVERNRERSPSVDRSRSRNQEGRPQCYKCKGYGHFMRDCPSSDFYTVGPTGLGVKKRETSQERQKPHQTAPPRTSL